jgi:hypothetical protein
MPQWVGRIAQAILALLLVVVIASGLLFTNVLRQAWSLISERAVKAGWKSQDAAIVLIAVVVMVMLGYIILVLPKWLAPDLTPSRTLEDVGDAKDRLTLEADRRKLQNDVRTGLLQGVGGAALIVGLIFTWIQFQANQSELSTQQELTRTQQDLTRRGQIADRFTRAVDELGNTGSVDVRLGGIYGLEQVARDFKDDRTRLAAYEVLSAYVRTHAVWDPNSPPPSSELGKRSPDVQAAMTVLGRRSFSKDDPDLDLHNVDLRYAGLNKAHLELAILDAAHLELSSLFEARLELAILDDAHLELAILLDAHLEGAILDSAHLEGAILDGAHLEGASLRKTDLSNTSLSGASLTGAHANKQTVWPRGFDWQAAGVLVDPT